MREDEISLRLVPLHCYRVHRRARRSASLLRVWPRSIFANPPFCSHARGMLTAGRFRRHKNERFSHRAHRAPAPQHGGPAPGSGAAADAEEKAAALGAVAMKGADVPPMALSIVLPEGDGVDVSVQISLSGAAAALHRW